MNFSAAQIIGDFPISYECFSKKFANLNEEMWDNSDGKDHYVFLEDKACDCDSENGFAINCIRYVYMKQIIGTRRRLGWSKI